MFQKFSLLLLSLTVLFSQTLLGQKKTWEGRAKAPIFQEDIQKAKSESLERAILQAVGKAAKARMVSLWWDVYQQDILKESQKNFNQLILNYRVLREGPSLDRTEYDTLVSIELATDRLDKVLTELDIPLLGGFQKPVLLLYPEKDPLFSVAKNRSLFISALKKRFGWLNLKLVGQLSLKAPEVYWFSSPFTFGQERKKYLEKRKALAGIFIETEESLESFNFRGLLFESTNGLYLENFGVEQPKSLSSSSWFSSSENLNQKLVQPFLAQLLPMRMRRILQNSGSKQSYLLSFQGLENQQEEQELLGYFSRAHPELVDFSLMRVSKDSVTYNVQREKASLSKKKNLDLKEQYGPFRLVNHFQNQDQWTLDIQKVESSPPKEMLRISEKGSSLLVQRELENFITSKHSPFSLPIYTEREDNGWFSQANLLPLGVVNYGFLRNRKDKDFYYIEGPAEKRVFRMGWYRVGRSNLSSQVNIYSEKKELTKHYRVKNHITVDYRLPKGEKGFYLEVSDKFGNLGQESGGYLHLHYLFCVESKEEKKCEEKPLVEEGEGLELSPSLEDSALKD